MKKVSLLILVSLILLMAFASCDMLPPLFGEEPEPEHVHDWMEATCEAPKTCACGATEGEKLPHTWAEATCSSPKVCTFCNKTEGAALNHKWVEADCDTPATCSLCGVTSGEALGHVWISASCDRAKHCAACYLEEGEPLEHVWAEATCLTPKTCTLCQETDGPALGHANETVPGYAATCKENGLTDGTVCTVCGETTLAQQIIPALGHTYSDWIVDLAPNCTEAGSKHKECTVCSATLTTESISALGHTETDWIEDKAATCDAKGAKHKECTVCGATTKTAAIPVLGHTEKAPVVENNVAPTCTENGSYDEVVYCATCGDELARNNVSVPALGHKMTDATCQTPSTCSVCGHTEGDVVACKAGETQKENEVAPKCEVAGSYDIATYCVWCNKELTRETYTVDALGHDMAAATCQAPATCKNGCGKTEGQPLDQHTIVVENMEEDFLYYVCATCDEYYVADKAHVYDGTNTKWNFAQGSGSDIGIKVVDGEYVIAANSDVRSQYMLYIPSSSKTGDVLKDFSAAKNAVGVVSFRMKTDATEDIRVILMEARNNNTNWQGWDKNSFDVLTIKNNKDGTYTIGGNAVTKDTFTTVAANEWFDVKMFVGLSGNTMTISYYINGVFCNAYSVNLDAPHNGYMLVSKMIESLYICGYTTGKGTGLVFDDLAIGYTTDSEWVFDSHKHVWADANCTAPKTCTACGLTEGEALGHELVDHAAQAPTCTEKGWEAYQTCNKCDYSSYKELAATGHNYGSATCDQAATCSVCGFSSGEALGHEFVDYKYNNDAKCELDGTKTAKCIRCDVTDTKTAEGTALQHNWASANCASPSTCTLCGKTGGEPDKTLHTALTVTANGSLATYACSACGYSFKTEVGDFLDGTHYNGMGVNAPNNGKYYTSNPDKANYPVLNGGYYEYVRNDVDAGTAAQLQVWLPSPNAGTNKFAGFSAASNSTGYLSFSINAYTDYNLEMKLVDNRVDNLDLNGDGTAESIRWSDAWAINDPVFRILPPSNGKAQLVGFNSTLLATVDVDENNYTGWIDVAIQLVLDPISDQVIATYYVNGVYAGTSARPLTTHTDAIQSVYINSNNKTAGTGYKIDNIAFGYTAHKHNLSSAIANGILTYSCECGASYRIEEFHEWNGDGSDSALKNLPNGNVELSVNANGQYEYIFKPATDVAPDFSASGTQSADGWYEYDGKGYAGGQLQMWMPSNNRGEGTFEDFSCENNAVGVISFNVKSNLTRHPDWDTSLTFSVGKPRNASDWSDGGSWTDDSINIFTIEEYQESGVVLKGGLNGTNINFGAIPVGEDGWSEWFNVMMVIEMTDDGYLTIYYYINSEFVGSDSRDLNNPGSNRTLNPKKIEALQISGWTYAPNTGIVFDDFYFGYTVEGHNTLDGHVHNVTNGATCADKSTCSCGWEGYITDHDFTEATCGAPATCKGCGMTKGEALTHNSLVAVYVDGNVQYTCKDCNKYYTLDGGMHDMGDISDATTAGLYNKTYDGKTLTMLNNGSDANAQHQFWVPGQTVSPDLAGFTCANNATGFLSFTINSKDDHNTGIEFKVNANRNTSNWGGPTNNGWSESSVGVFKIMPHKDTDTTVALTGYNGAALGNWTMTGTDGWTGEMNVVIKIQLYANNTVSLDYYINGEFFANVKADMVIWTYDISSLYVNGRTNSEGDGYILSNLYFGYTVSGLHDAPVVEEPFYKNEISKDEVENELLKAIVTNKIKQWDQSSAHNNHNGTPVYVVADKNGEDVQALYFSKTDAWVGDEGEQFSEFRFDVDGSKKAVSISFDYKAEGTVEKNERYTFTDLEGNTFSADSYVQIKTPANHPLAKDNYPELPGTEFVLDGEWHTMTYTFPESLEIINILVCLYHFQGELLIANVNVEFEQPAEEPFYTEEIAKENVSSSVLQTVVTNKIKQWDQSSAHNSHEGTPVFVKADMNGTEVTGVYFSKTTPWVGDEGEQFSEFRVNVDSSKKAAGFSFVYKVEGTVDENKGKAEGGYDFKDLEGNVFTADAYVQIKTPSNHPLAGDNYPELSGTDFILDGQWHTMTYTFKTPLEITNMLFNFYHFQGQLIIANLEVTFVEECQHTNTSTNKVDATCTAAGSVKVTCNDCGATVSEETLPATNHANKTTNTVEATCLNAGSNKVVCDDCGEILVDEVLPATGHKLAVTTVSNNVTCTCTACGASYVADTSYSYTGNNNTWNWSQGATSDISLNVVDGEYVISANSEIGSQYMLYIPSSNRNYAMQGFTGEANAFGVVSFKVKTDAQNYYDENGKLVQPGTVRFILMEARNANDNWKGWSDNSVDVLAIQPNNDGTYKVHGNSMTSTTLTTIAANEWLDVKMLVRITPEQTMTIDYYLNDTFCGSFTKDFNAENYGMRLVNNLIESLYICGWTQGQGTGVVFDDLYIGYSADGHNVFEGEHTLTEATCQTGATCSCGWTGAPIAHKLNYTVEGETVVASCAYGCGEGYSVAKGYYTDGTTSANVFTPLGGNATAGYTTNTNGAPVVSEDGYLVFARGEGYAEKGQFQLHCRDAAWQACDQYFPDFSTEKSAVGVLDFNINLNLDTTGNLRFIITERVESGFAWGKNDITLLTFSPASADGKITLNGWGVNNLATFQKGEDGYTGWINIKVTIELSKNAKDENIGLVKFYVNGEHVGTTHSHLTTLLGGRINNLYITGNSTNVGTGFMLDDFVFGYTPHEHVYAEKDTKPTCTEAGFTTFTCDCGESYTGNEVAALGHDFDVANCTSPKTCAICDATEGEALGHDMQPATCSSASKCSRCSHTEGEALPHADENGDYKCDVCSAAVLPRDGEALTIVEALAVAKVAGSSYSKEKYYITGIVTNVYNTQYGNLYLKDAEGNQICIYGLYSADGKTRYDAMEVKPAEGDEITVYTVLGTYNSTPQGKNAWLDELVVHEHDYVGVVTAPTCISGGLTTYTCSLCKGSYTAEVTEALGHTTEEGECSRCGQTVGGDAVVAQYVKITDASEFTTGTYVLIVNSKNVTLSTFSSNWVKGSTLNAGDVIEKSVGDSYAITLEVSDSGVKIKIGSNYIKPKSGNNNGIETGSYTWAYQFQANGTVVFKGINNDTTTLAYNVQNAGFRAYKNSTVSGNASGYPSYFTVYKLVG